MTIATFTVTLSAPSASTVTVDYTTVDGTAVAPTNYIPVNGRLTFAPGETIQNVMVTVNDLAPNTPSLDFSLRLTNSINGTVIDAIGIGIIPGALDEYVTRFNWMYDQLHNTANGYFGPSTGSKAFTLPYYVPEEIIVEGVDWGHESESRTASFWIGLEAWKGLLSDDWSGFNTAWISIDTNYVPNVINQPIAIYQPTNPADYMPDEDIVNDYPVMAEPGTAKGYDGLYQELLDTYGNKRIYLMHHMLDVDGIYGFHNGDMTTTGVYIDNHQRGLSESTFESVTVPSWEDYSFGMLQYGYLPLFSQGQPLYPTAPSPYSKQFRYTSAPDAEVRTIQWSVWADKWAMTKGTQIEIGAQLIKTRKMGDYLRYTLFDKYFRQIGNNRAQGATAQTTYSACHYLISWSASWGGEIPIDPASSAWSFRTGSSEAHQGYQAPNIAYHMATGGGGYTPLSELAGDYWLGALYRQIDLIRWLQTPQGPIAGGVTNSWQGRYLTPTDGRETSTFYGMYYTYAPIWHDPPSNNWFGFQCWGLQRMADLFVEIADKTSSLAVSIRPNVEMILDRFVGWALDHVTVGTDSDFVLPITLSWTSPIEVVGKTTTAPNLEGVYEYLPTFNWDGTGDHINFWNPATVPNPNLDVTIVSSGHDLGVAASLSLLLLHYAQAKRLMDKFTTTVSGSSFTSFTGQDVYNLAKSLVDCIWDAHRDPSGITHAETRADYQHMADSVYIPANFAGKMPDGRPIAADLTTFLSIRSFYQDATEYNTLVTYLADLDNTTAPSYNYHRFWANCEFAMACAAIHHYFADLL
jgi:hypothetical protein